MCGDTSCVQCAAVSYSTKYLCASTDNKTLVVWVSKVPAEESHRECTWEKLGSRYMEKEPTKSV